MAITFWKQLPVVSTRSRKLQMRALRIAIVLISVLFATFTLTLSCASVLFGLIHESPLGDGELFLVRWFHFLDADGQTEEPYILYVLPQEEADLLMDVNTEYRNRAVLLEYSNISFRSNNVNVSVDRAENIRRQTWISLSIESSDRESMSIILNDCTLTTTEGLVMLPRIVGIESRASKHVYVSSIVAGEMPEAEIVSRARAYFSYSHSYLEQAEVSAGLSDVLLEENDACKIVFLYDKQSAPVYMSVRLEGKESNETFNLGICMDYLSSKEGKRLLLSNEGKGWPTVSHELLLAKPDYMTFFGK